MNAHNRTQIVQEETGLVHFLFFRFANLLAPRLWDRLFPLSAPSPLRSRQLWPRHCSAYWHRRDASTFCTNSRARNRYVLSMFCRYICVPGIHIFMHICLYIYNNTSAYIYMYICIYIYIYSFMYLYILIYCSVYSRRRAESTSYTNSRARNGYLQIYINIHLPIYIYIQTFAG